ncbi:MAG: hypothetical protein RIC16_05995 [Rhodospirillales bacterium]
MSQGRKRSWTYRTYPLDSSPAAFGPFQDFFDLWLSKRGSGRRYAEWQDFQLEDFHGWYGQLSLGEIHDDPFDLSYRLWGTLLVEWWGIEMTGKLLSSYPWAGNIWEANERPYMEHLVANSQMGFVSGPLSSIDRDVVYIEGVELPLGKGETISHILSAYRRADPDNPFLPELDPVFLR